MRRQQVQNRKYVKNDRWLFSHEELTKRLPSHLHGITEDEEFELRKSTCQFVQLCGKNMKVPQMTIATALIYFHRFYALHSFQDYDRFFVGATCIFLAGKTEETPKELKDVIRITQEIQQDKFSKSKHKAIPRPGTKEFEEIRTKILEMERILLQTLHFDLTIQHPYKPLIALVEKIEPPQQHRKKLAQVGWNFINDSLRTKMCLEYPYYQISAACVVLSSMFLKINLPGRWDQRFDVGCTKEEINDICRKILRVYGKNHKLLAHFQALITPQPPTSA